MSFQRQPQSGMLQPQSPFMFPQQNLPVGFEPQFQGELFHQQPQFGHGHGQGHGQLEQQINRLERRVNQLERDRDAMDKRIKKLESGSSHNHGQGHHHGHQHYFQPRPVTYDPNGY